MLFHPGLLKTISDIRTSRERGADPRSKAIYLIAKNTFWNMDQRESEPSSVSTEERVD